MRANIYFVVAFLMMICSPFTIIFGGSMWCVPLFFVFAIGGSFLMVESFDMMRKENEKNSKY